MNRPKRDGYCAYYARPVHWAYPEGCPKLRDGYLTDVVYAATRLAWEYIGSADETRRPIGLRILNQMDVCNACDRNF